jgi:hypothetical protein
MCVETISGSLASATVADLKLADLYAGPVTWIGERGDGDALKVVYERIDGDFETFTLGELRARAWWRLGRPEHVVSIEALMRTSYGQGMPSPVDDRGTHGRQVEHREDSIRADQARVRARRAAT